MSKLEKIQTAVGSATLFAVLFFGLRAILPEPLPITIHELSYKDGMVTVDRTINTDQLYFFMRKSGDVIDQKTMEPVPECSGVKAANFMAGRRSDTVSLARWSGNDRCTPEILANSTFKLLAVYTWGDHQVAVTSGPFTIGDVP